MVLWARPEGDEDEGAVVRRLSRARKAPRDVVMRARMIELSGSGLRVPAIAVELGCSQKTVRCWLHRFNRLGLQGLDDLGGQGRKRRITELERSRIISLVKTVPPGRLRWGALTLNPEHGLCGLCQRSWCVVEGVLEGDW